MVCGDIADFEIVDFGILRKDYFCNKPNPMRPLILLLTCFLFLCACNNSNDIKAGNDSLNNRNISDTTGRENVIDSGEVLYKTNCTSCHDIAKVAVAPALAWEGKLMPKQWLRDYTRNNFAMKKKGDKYALILDKEYPVVMTQFDFLTDGQIDAIYRYIDTTSKRLKLPEPLHMREY